jgi:hypothetical protein
MQEHVQGRKKMLELLQALASLKKSRVERRMSQFRSTVRWRRRRPWQRRRSAKLWAKTLSQLAEMRSK